MILIVVALHTEAKPLIEALKLKKIDEKFEVFSNEEYILIVTGMNKINSIIATTYMLAKYKIEVTLNFGTAGTKDKSLRICEPILINEIIDFETKANFYPDILIKHPFKEDSITTFNSPVKNQKFNTNLVDMEASGFYQASVKFLSPEKIFILKIISDYLDISIPQKEFIIEIVSKNMDLIVEFLNELKELKKTTLLNDIELNEANIIIKNLNLTKSQQIQLIDLMKYKKLKTHELNLNEFLNVEIKSKRERDEVFKSLKKTLF